MATQKALFSLFSNTPLKSDFSNVKDDNYLILQTPPEIENFEDVLTIHLKL